MDDIIINILEGVPNMTILLIGRVLGGISTSLLFSAFESWMVTEHRAQGFAENQLGKTFAIASEINGIVAVVAGLVAQVAADTFGEIGPFRAAVAVTAVAAAFVFAWTENYGSSFKKVDPTPEKNAHSEGRQGNIDSGVLAMDAYALGLCYSLFEGAMYVFVFLWYPTLEVSVPDGILPSGLVFSSFMLCIAIGGKLFDLVDATFLREEAFLLVATAAAAASLLVPTVTDNYRYILVGFLMFEVCVGVISPCCATLRSKYFPKDQFSTTLSLFRMPTNMLVVLGTGGASYLTNNQLFLGCAAVLIVATGCAAKLAQTPSTPPTSTQKLKEQ
ncbi:hypothetical protein BBO99_00000842 [Phytophthora kernoviae]|uniref:Molybdate-anion transporter n=2 Tax=Phytophthora kernoviae TaxID=325452 RepID=A0A3R7H4U3_9STRA|nr:hypothetical protein G195_001565 [Phytophthora kernoviae 00238/432]KAG2531834.1 hypothetical protein JM16_000667 [Phytophthora kernoviae]KAG2532704.1 hypothetical protein JM18_000749 [Phytophthora kernoviae]RLN44385.1 hypothetical protein BBI17_000978 [Phytophthora kernoviae]RLN85008.1 hypothetical protein BBO99_00000842 [Phytophthora kernoviae]